MSMNKTMKAINEEKITLEFSIDEIVELRNLLEKDALEKGQPTEDGCKCPRCGTELIEGYYHCPCCGQRVSYIKSDVVPL